jgi:hypothetical protein
LKLERSSSRGVSPSYASSWHSGMITVSDRRRAKRDMGDKDSVRMALNFMAAVRDQRIKDMLALVDPEIICEPLARPGRTMYKGHDGMVLFVSDMHTVFGRYQFEIDEITERDGAKVAVQARILPESGYRPMPPMPIVILFTLRDDLITLVEGKPGTGAP